MGAARHRHSASPRPQNQPATLPIHRRSPRRTLHAAESETHMWLTGKLVTAADGSRYSMIDRILNAHHDCAHKRNGLTCNHG